METKRTRVRIRQPHHKSSCFEPNTGLSSQRNVRDSCFWHLFSLPNPRVKYQHVHHKTLSWFLQQTVLQQIDNKTISRSEVPTRQTSRIIQGEFSSNNSRTLVKVKLKLYRISQWHFNNFIQTSMLSFTMQSTITNVEALTWVLHFKLEIKTEHTREVVSHKRFQNKVWGVICLIKKLKSKPWVLPLFSLWAPITVEQAPGRTLFNILLSCFLYLNTLHRKESQILI